MNQDTSPSADQEFAAIQTVHGALTPLDPDARNRVIKYIVSLLGIDARVGSRSEPEVDEEEDVEADNGHSNDLSYGSLADLHNAADPKTHADKALVAGVWLQECQGNDDFTAQAANKELSHLGEGLPNITGALESLKKRKPARVLQLRKSGKSKQARKTYKITVAGVNAMKEMIGG